MSPASTTEVAPAKLNLWLRVLGRRPDGLHALQSLVVPLDWGDRVTVSVEALPDGSAAAAPRIRCRCPAHPDLEDGQDLAAQAARAVLHRVPGRWACELHLHKEIPLAAGLGGGSTDAAAVLRALGQLVPGVTPAELRALAPTLGADVPVCLANRPSWVTGAGERLQAAAPLPDFHLCLAHPDLVVSTAERFAALGAGPAGAPPPLPAPPQTLADLAALVGNDFLPGLVAAHPPLSGVRAALRATGARAVGLSGSGPTLFGLYATRAEADAAARALGDQGLRARAASPGEAGAFLE